MNENNNYNAKRVSCMYVINTNILGSRGQSSSKADEDMDIVGRYNNKGLTHKHCMDKYYMDEYQLWRDKVYRDKHCKDRELLLLELMLFVRYSIQQQLISLL